MENAVNYVNGKVKITLWASLIAYGVLNSIIYSWFFWSKFNVNIMHFATINDLIPLIIYTMALPLLLMFITFLSLRIWELVVNYTFPIIDILVYRYSINTFLTILIKIILTLLFVFTVFFILHLIYPYFNLDVMLNDESGFIKALIGFCSAILGLILSRVKTFLPEVEKHRWVIFCFFLAIPGLTYAFADDQAGFILKGIDTFIISSKVDCEQKQGEKFRYISTISDKTIALSLLDGSICVYKYTHLRLQKEEKINYSTISSSQVSYRM